MKTPKPKTYTQKEFSGILINVDSTDLPEKNCVDCANIDISTEGELSSIDGMEKQITTGLGYEITAIHQVNNSNFAYYNDTIGKL